MLSPQSYAPAAMGVRRINHDDVSFELEEDWLDASQISYLAPPDTSLASDFAKRAAAAGAPKLSEAPANPISRGNFVLSRRPYPVAPDADVKDLLERELRLLVGMIPSSKPGELRWGKMGDADAAIIEIELKLEGLSALQLHAIAQIDGRLFHFCGTSPGRYFESERERFERIMASIQVDA